jgi:hypothetical protein
MSNAKPPAGGPSPSGAASPSPIVADLGRRGRKAIKKLRKGQGPLLDDAQKVIEQLRADHTIVDGAQPVIVIVKERRCRSGMFL